MIMAVKNLNFSDDEFGAAYVKSDVQKPVIVPQPPLSGVRRANDPVAPVVKPARSVTVQIRKDKNGLDVPDYSSFDLPAFQRHNITPAIETVKPLSSPRAPAKEVQVRSSGAISGFIASMKKSANTQKGCIDFSLPNENEVAFRQFPDAISLGERQPDDEVILAMLQIGHNEFGQIEVFGSDEFIQAAINVAIKNGIVLQNKEYIHALSKTSSAPGQAARMKV
jgi:hypothetical protein